MRKGLRTTMPACTDLLDKMLQEHCPGCSAVQSVDETIRGPVLELPSHKSSTRSYVMQSSMRALNLLLEVRVMLHQMDGNDNDTTLFINVSRTHSCMSHCVLMGVRAYLGGCACAHRFMCGWQNADFRPGPPTIGGGPVSVHIHNLKQNTKVLACMQGADVCAHVGFGASIVSRRFYTTAGHTTPKMPRGHSTEVSTWHSRART